MGDSKISRVIVVVVVMFLGSQSEAQLSSNFYGSLCPRAVGTIRAAVNKAVMKEHRMGASLLRLHFHDCFVNGCDGSILLDDDTTSGLTGEKTAGPNDDSVRGFEVIDAIKSELESLCPSTVSCSDILAVAARDSVVVLGGPSWPVEVGRRDSSSANFSSANNDLPSPALDLPALIKAFSNKGFTEKDMVALSGSHTMGQARCLIYRDRIYNESNINSAFATSLKSGCPSAGGDANLTSLDVTTPVFFDNGYFKNLVNNKGLLHSDQQLYNGGSTDTLVTTYANNKLSFFADFAAAMVKMGRLDPLTGTAGQIRTNCRKIN